MAKEDSSKYALRKRVRGNAAPRPGHRKPRSKRTCDARSQTQPGYGIAFHAVVFLAAFLIVFSRRPDALLHAQFWAEDGKYWFRDAYQFGFRSLLRPQDGYLQTASRFAALLSLAVPFHMAPLVMNLCAITAQILPVNVFLSSRYSELSLRTRALGGFLSLAIPNSYEIDANVTNLQWHLGLLACLVLLAGPARDWRWRVFDGVVLVLVSLHSVMGVLLVPLAAFLWRRHQGWSGVMPFVLLVPGAAIQTLSLLLSQSREHRAMGASLARLATILGRQIFLPAVLGSRTVLDILSSQSAVVVFAIETIAAAAGIAILLFALRYGPTELRLFILFALAVFTLCLIWPVGARTTSQQWDSLMTPGGGNRYYFLPMVAFLASLVWLALDPSVSRKIRYAGAVVLLLLPIGIYQDWYYPAFRNFHFPRYAAQFERAPSGTQFTIPINPDWMMQLTKK